MSINKVCKTITNLQAVEGKPPNIDIGRVGAVGHIHLIFGRGRVSNSWDQLEPLSPSPYSQTIVAWCLLLGLTTYVLPNSNALLTDLPPELSDGPVKLILASK